MPTVSVCRKRRRPPKRSACCVMRVRRFRRSATTSAWWLRACGRRATCARDRDAGRSHGADSAPAPVAACDRGPRHGRCAAHRGVFRRASGADRTGARTDRGDAARQHRAVGATEAAARGRRLGRHLPSAARDQHARCGQRLRGRARVAVAARIGRDTAGVPEGGRAADPGRSSSAPRVVVADDRGCGRVSRVRAAPDTARALGRACAAAQRARLAAVPGALSARSAAYTLSVLGALFRWLIEQRYLLANPFAGARCATRAARTHSTRRCVHRRRVAARAHDRRRGLSSAGHAGRAAVGLDAGRRATAALHSRFRLCDRAARERAESARRSATSRPMRTATRG